MTFVTFSRLILLSFWLGAALFFGAVVAPATFSVLRSFDLPNASEIAGTIVTRCLSVVNISGFLIGVLLLASVVLGRAGLGRMALLIECVCIVLIILATGIGHWVIAMRMRALRAAMYLPIDQVPMNDPRRMEFNTLHVYSVNVLGIAMIAALIVIFLIARNLRS